MYYIFKHKETTFAKEYIKGFWSVKDMAYILESMFQRGDRLWRKIKGIPQRPLGK